MKHCRTGIFNTFAVICTATILTVCPVKAVESEEILQGGGG